MLLDTHVVLWLLADDTRLGARARHLLVRGDEVRVSSVSIWEIAIKAEMGKLTVPDDLPDRIDEAGLTRVDITAQHAWASRDVAGLPHRDPFDRMLLVQAWSERVALLTADRALLSAPLTPAVEVVDARA